MQPIVDALEKFHYTCATEELAHFNPHAHVLFNVGYAETLTITSQTILRIESVIP